MPTTEDENSPKAKAAKIARSPRTKKVATAVSATVRSDAVVQPTLPHVAASSNALETTVWETTKSSSDPSLLNRASLSAESVSATLPAATTSTTAAQPLGANLSSYAPAGVTAVVPSSDAAPTTNQLTPTQRPKISPLAPPSVESMSNALPVSLLNNLPESVGHATTEAYKLSHLATDSTPQLAQPKVVKLSSDENSTRNNPNANGSNDRNTAVQSDLRLVGTASANTASAATAQVAATKAIAPTHNASEQPGVMLRQAREARGLSVADVANRLRMGNRQVTALEAGQFEDLPEGTFLRGFARNFSKVVGADTNAVLAALEAVNPDTAAPSTSIAPPVQNMQYSQHRPEPSRFSPKLGLLALVAVALSGAVWYWFEHVRNAPGTAAPTPVTAPAINPSDANTAAGGSPSLPLAVPADANGKTSDGVIEPAIAIGAATVPLASQPLTTALTPSTTVSTTAPSATAPVLSAALTVPSPNAPVAPVAVDRVIDKNTAASATAATATSEALKLGNSRLAFVFTDTSWVEVADARGNLIVNRTFKKGETHQVDGRTPFSIVIGNAKNATMQYNGAPFDLAPHTKVSVARLRLR